MRTRRPLFKRALEIAEKTGGKEHRRWRLPKTFGPLYVVNAVRRCGACSGARSR